jgi:hypothetical protein
MKSKKALFCALCASVVSLPAAAPYQKPEFPVRIGQITPRPSLQATSPRLGIGFEKLDRAVFDPEKAYDKIAPIGVKHVRIVSGWQRTEKQKGVYDFAWLDSIVNNLLQRGMSPWICLLYGNELYTPDAAKVFGAVGVPPLNSPEAKQAWLNYIRAIATHFKGRVSLYEIWNEPDGLHCWKHGVNPLEYADFAIATSKTLRAADPSATIAGGVIHILKDLSFTTALLNAGLANHIDAFTYHCYAISEITYQKEITALKALIHSYNPAIKLINGESGTQSRPDGMGALKGKTWTPRKQAKWLLRHMITDLSLDIEFTSYFSSLDMIEALNGKVGDKASYLDYGYFGVLAADFDPDGKSTGDYTPKPAFYALQNLCAAITSDVTLTPLPIRIISGITGPSGVEPGVETTGAALQYHGFRKPNGSAALAIWNATDLLTTEYDGSFSFAYANLPKPIRIVDLLTGNVFDIPDSLHSPSKYAKNAGTLKNLPLKDHPILITFGDFLNFTPGK